MHKPLALKVKSDEAGRMIPSELDSAIQQSLAEGKTPLYVNATSGSTVMGEARNFFVLYYVLLY